MAKKISSEYKIAIFSALIGISFTAIYDFIKEKPILSTFWKFLKWIWVNIFEFQVSIWQILIALFIIILILFLIPDKKNPTPDFLDYTTDTFEDIIWRWKWQWISYRKEWNVKDLIPLCIKCGTATTLEETISSHDYANCPRCNQRMTRIKKKNKIEAIIIDNLDRKIHLEKIK